MAESKVQLSRLNHPDLSAIDQAIAMQQYANDRLMHALVEQWDEGDPEL